MNLTTEADLATQFGISEAKAAELRKKKGWPHVRLTRFDVRYTDAQVEQIVAQQTVTAKKAATVAVAGQTSRSASRSKAS